MRKLAFILACSAAAAGPLRAEAPAAPLPHVLSDSDRATYTQGFAALHAADWATAAAAFARLRGGALTAVGQAELCLARGAPVPDTTTLTALLATAPELPQAPAVAQLARKRGADALPPLPATHDLFRVAGASKRQAARSRSDAAAQRLAGQVQPLVKAGTIAAAEPLVEQAAATLTPEALTEWRQRLAWAYYQTGDDASARRMAELARTGAGEWAVQAAWVAGLAAWRAADYAAAADAFTAVAGNGGDAETIAAGHFWAARAMTAAGKPDRVAAHLRAASRLGETFYGLVAGAALGVPPPAPTSLAAADPDALLRHPDLRAAAALMEIGEPQLADQMIRQQARIGAASEHIPLIAFAGRLGLPATQLWLAQNAPAGVVSSPAQRYPMPAWAPSGGWRIDRALLYAHALQESQFRTDAVSRAGARGLMQIMPATARLVARHRGDPMAMADRMGEPALNFEYGQSYLEELAAHYGTGGLLPKVIAAYNAGPNNVALWNQPATQHDPLLFIESIPFSETRAYVAIVLRNYWMYQRQSGAATASLNELATGRWPLFPRRATSTPAATVAARADDGPAVAGGIGN
ncbi:lytic transglycosylase domain-containing protein [Sphingomonas nostoxanthinifaciens]|uniref:lytic transglycosylase domain-containing protein n=1 Tax=Sphingomonas nostoxanthinifaciens TaxID=2872652 RepID=UPI001CC1E9BE|nr:lytic transglycosylase domain-containing protein [Sphingomonas nostoxanthinifaciens]UAK26202.1 lytic transglycosylase domain-containing protein [Sphingomonas nostoxanthinifaciens]